MTWETNGKNTEIRKRRRCFIQQTKSITDDRKLQNQVQKKKDGFFYYIKKIEIFVFDN